MNVDMDSLQICGNILSTKNYNYFALRCAHCGDSFGQWTSFIKHLEQRHNDGNDDILADLIKGELGDEEYLEEDDDKYSIKNELQSMNGAENFQEPEKRVVKYESEKEEGHLDTAVLEVNLTEDALDENFVEDSEEDTEKPAKATKITTRGNNKSKRETEHFKPFNFNLNNAELKRVSLEFLKVFEENAFLWDYKHEDYRKHRTRNKSFSLIKLHLKKMGYFVSDLKLNRIISDIVRDYRKAKEELALHGKLEKSLQFLLNKCKFLDEPVGDAASIYRDAESDDNDDSDSDDSENLVETPDFTEEFFYKSNSRIKRIRFHIPSNKLVVDLIDLWRENPLLWDATRSNYNNNNDRKRILESWIPIFKERHNITFSYQDLNKNLQLLRRYIYTLSSRKVFDEAAKYIKKACSFLPSPKNKGRFKCDTCSNFFLTETNYKAHLYNEHQIGECPFKCEECAKVFPSKHHFELHVKRLHAKQLDFVCTVCDKRFLRKCQLTYHVHTHTGEKPFICETCGKGFRLRENLKNHEIRIHLRLRNFTCHMCPKAFYTKSLLKDHLNAHLNIRNNKCPVCDKGFHSAHALMRHKQIHSEVKRYACKLCDAKFHQFVGLNSHIKSRHKYIQGENEETASADIETL